MTSTFVTAAGNSGLTHSSRWIDRFGSCGSLLCAVHCGLAAFAPSLLVAVSPSLRSHFIEWLLVGFATAMAAVALCLGMRQHRSRTIAGAFAVFIIGLVGARLMEASGIEGPAVAIAVVAGLGLMVTHLFNARACRGCQECQPEDSA